MKIQNETEQGIGIGQKTNLTFGNVWRVVDLSTRSLVTTSGRLHTSTLNDTITQVIQGWQNRQADFSIDLNGTIVAILHPDNNFELEP